MQPRDKAYLHDILVSIDSIFDYLGENTTLADYQANKQLRRAVEREIEIIGEAVSKLLKTNPTISIENARQIVNTRNWVIHSYDTVDDIIIWGIVKKHLPRLRTEADLLLKA